MVLGLLVEKLKDRTGDGSTLIGVTLMPLGDSTGVLQEGEVGDVWVGDDWVARLVAKMLDCVGPVDGFGERFRALTEGVFEGHEFYGVVTGADAFDGPVWVWSWGTRLEEVGDFAGGVEDFIGWVIRVAW
jgi:hypothetical protein